jgi:tRNA threonylcarbamoyladenosine biosynthesis protein TsaB
MDARMHEVYWSLHAPAQQGVVSDAAEHVSAPATLLQFLAGQASGGEQILAAGCGLAAYFRDNAAFGVPALRQLPQAEPHAREIARLAVADFAAGLALPAEAAIPVYVRDQVVQTPRA